MITSQILNANAGRKEVQKMDCNDKNKFSTGGVCDTSPCRSCGRATKSCTWSECPKFKKWFSEAWSRLPGQKKEDKK